MAYNEKMAYMFFMEILDLFNRPEDFKTKVGSMGLNSIDHSIGGFKMFLVVDLWLIFTIVKFYR